MGGGQQPERTDDQICTCGPHRGCDVRRYPAGRLPAHPGPRAKRRSASSCARRRVTKSEGWCSVDIVLCLSFGLSFNARVRRRRAVGVDTLRE